MASLKGIEISGRTSELLTASAKEFLLSLERQFGLRRRELLTARKTGSPTNKSTWDFLPQTASVRERDWKVAPVPALLLDRRVEITGPTDPKMVINALNSGANVFMADFEDSLSPTWENLISGQESLFRAVRRTLTFESPEGKHYKLNEKTAVLFVRPRGWHLEEAHVKVDGCPMSGGLFDFGVFVDFLFALHLVFSAANHTFAAVTGQNGVARIGVGVLTLVGTTLGAQRVWTVEVVELQSALEAHVARAELALVLHHSLAGRPPYRLQACVQP